MLVGEAINTKTVVLMIGDPFAKGMEMMDKLHVNSLPVVDVETNEIVGKMSRTGLETGDAAQLISQQDLEEPVAIFNNQHLFEAIK